MNTNDPIEELFRNNQHGLDEKPRDLLWDRIEERLEEKSIQKRKTEWWKYATVASVVIGMMIGVWALLNNENTINSEMTNPQIVLEDASEINKENVSEILDKLEENKQSVVIREEKKSAPEIMESESEVEPPKIAMSPVYDAEDAMTYENVLQNPPEPAIEMESAKPAAKAKEESEIVVFRGSTPEKKDGNYIKRNETASSTTIREEDMRRIGNMADASVMYEKIESDTLKVFGFWVKISNARIQYNRSSDINGIAIFTNFNVGFPKKIIVNHNSDNFIISYEGDEKQRNSKESKEIQKYVNENKSNIFYPIDIE